MSAACQKVCHAPPSRMTTCRESAMPLFAIENTGRTTTGWASLGTPGGTVISDGRVPIDPVSSVHAATAIANIATAYQAFML